MQPRPVIAVVGPTSSGKSALAVRLARRFNGEIISADSRQVYHGLDIGSGKITKREMKGIPHYLLDVVRPQRTFTVAQYQKLARRVLEDIVRRGRMPIVCGGTGFYIDALRGHISLPSVPPNPKSRIKLEKLSTEKLGEKLKVLDRKRFENIDLKNRRRLIRAIEIAVFQKGSTFLPQGRTLTCGWSKDGPCWLILGIKLEPTELKRKINARLKSRLRCGLIAEVRKLHENGVSWRRLDELGLEYRYAAKLLREQERDFRDASEPVSRRVKREGIAFLEKQLAIATWHYAKRQMTWFKRDQTIQWVKNYKEAERLTVAFLRKSGKITRAKD